jgi:large subunit ribosomal protein L53
MITTYLASLKTTFNPFSTSSKIPRLLINLLPASAHKTIQIKSTALPRGSTEPATLEVAFKDGKILKYSWTHVAKPKEKDASMANGKLAEKTTLQDIVDEVNRHARIAIRKEELSG